MVYENWLESLKKFINNLSLSQLRTQATQGDPDAKSLAEKRLKTLVPRRSCNGVEDQDTEL